MTEKKYQLLFFHLKLKQLLIESFSVKLMKTFSLK